MSIVTRFAPSPTGFLHLGHAFSAFNARRAARQAGGRFLLRLEDIDQTRCRPAFAAAIEEDLRWLGLDWDGEVRVQSEHLDAYAADLAALRERRLIYPCFCTRADIAAAANAPHGGELVYPGTCRVLSETERSDRIAAGAAFAWRLDVGRALTEVGSLQYEEARIGEVPCHPGRFGDVVLGRKDAPASYHLCVTHDDAAQGVTLVTRGGDLAPLTEIHRLIQALMGWPAPLYAHHPLVLDAAGKRLAKRDRAATLRAMRDAGWSPEAVLASLPGLPVQPN